MKRLIVICTIVAFILTATNLAQAVIRNVPSAYPTIQSAIDAAINGDEVFVADGIYAGTGNRDIDFNGKAIIVRSQNGPASCTINCQGTQSEPHRGFYFHSGETIESILDGFTITNGYGPVEPVYETGSVGGGIFCHNASCPQIENCIIENNEAELRGGGLYCYNCSSPTVIDSSISNNIVHYYGSRPTGGPGGGVCCSIYSSPSLQNCVINSNSTTKSSGGGLFGETGCDFQLINCVIRDNSAYSIGGAFKCEHWSSPSLINCLLVNNSAGFEGAAIGLYSSSNAMITNCTIISNSITVGSAIQCVTSCSPTFSNCILWNSVPDEFTLESSSPDVRYSDVQGGDGQPWFGVGCIDTDPLFADADGRLTSGSPCIDVGNSTAVPPGVTTDLDGNFRIQGTCVDMGAFEARPATPKDMLLIMALYIEAEVDADRIDAELEDSLLAKVNAAILALDRGNPNDAKVTMNDLKALINQVEAQTDKKITIDVAEEVVESANEIIATLGG